MNHLTAKITALLLVLALGGVTEAASAMASPQSATTQSQQNASEKDTASAPAPDANSTPAKGNGEPSLPDSPSAAQSANQNQDNANQSLQEPRGTAAARAAKTQGGAASKPAGAAIAPAKQRRTRSLLIKLGVIAGAGAALGTVYALAKGSPSRPPGAH
jgi:hypothetical protein